MSTAANPSPCPMTNQGSWLHAEAMAARGASYSSKLIGDRIDLLREQLGYKTAKEFADFLGVDQNTLTMWLRGDRTPQLDKIARLREKTGVTADYLLYGDTSTLPLHLFRLLSGRQAEAS